MMPSAHVLLKNRKQIFQQSKIPIGRKRGAPGSSEALWRLRSLQTLGVEGCLGAQRDPCRSVTDKAWLIIYKSNPLICLTFSDFFQCSTYYLLATLYYLFAIHFSIGQYELTLGISSFLRSTGTILASCKERTQLIRSHNTCRSGTGLDRKIIHL